MFTSNPSHTYRTTENEGVHQKGVQLVHSLAQAVTVTLTLTLTHDHLANKPQQTTSTLFGLMHGSTTDNKCLTSARLIAYEYLIR